MRGDARFPVLAPPEARAPRRLLIVTSEPPPTSSGLGTLWAKLALGAVDENFGIDFLGPDPDRCSNHGSSGLPTRGRLFDLGPPPLSRLSSVRRNATAGASRAGWGVLRAPWAAWERLTRENLYEEWIRRRVAEVLPRILEGAPFDAVAGKAPHLETAETVMRICERSGVPFLFVMGDPVGHRGADGELVPSHPERVQGLIDAAAAFVTRGSSYQRHYRRLFRIDPRKVVFFEDSFVPVGRLAEATPGLRVGGDALLHWGHVAPWRPLTALVEALRTVNGERRSEGREPLGLTVMGRIIEAGMLAEARRGLGPLLQELPALPYLEARAVARTARRFVVIVSHRHRDNIPSKLIDGLAYGRPVLVLTHPDSASAELVKRLGVGVVADVRDVGSIVRGLHELEEGRESFERAHADASLSEAWSVEHVGRRFREQLSRALGWQP